MSLLAKLRQSVTVEPIIFFFAAVGGLSDATNNHMLYRKICISQYHNDSMCDLIIAGRTNETQEEIVQGMTSKWQFYSSLVYTFPAILSTTVYGSWSDRFSRKKPLYLPIVGTILSVAIYLLCAIFMEGSVAYLLIASLIYGLSGGWVTLLMASFSYMSQISSQENRTIRVAIIEALMLIGAAAANFASGPLLEAGGFVVVYSIVICVFLLVLLYVVIWIPEIKPPQRPEDKEVTGKDDEGKIEKKEVKRTPWLSWRHVRETLVIGLKPRQNKRRAHLMVQFVCVFFVTLVTGQSDFVNLLI